MMLVRTRNTLTNNIQQVIMRREAASGSVEGVFTCELGLDMNPIYVLYPSELLLTVLFVKYSEIL